MLQQIANTDIQLNQNFPISTINSGASALTLQTGGTTAVTVDTSQNVGIGISSPSYKLQATSTGGTAISATDTTSGSSSYAVLRADSQSSSGYLLQGNASFGSATPAEI